MSLAAAAVLLAAAWSDPAGHIRCEVPDSFTAPADQPWRFTRGDGLRQLVFLTVRPVSVGPAERARQLLERTGAAGVSVAHNTAKGALEPSLAAAFSVAPTDPTWSGVLVLGPPAADVAAEAHALAATCRRVPPAISNGRVYDFTRRLSAQIPFGLDSLELRGAGAVQGEGFTLRLTAVQAKTTPSLEEIAIGWLAPSGATLTGTAGASAGPDLKAVVIASGTLKQNGLEYLIEVAAIDLGDGEVGGLGLSASPATAARARSTLDAMLRTVAVTPKR